MEDCSAAYVKGSGGGSRSVPNGHEGSKVADSMRRVDDVKVWGVRKPMCRRWGRQ